MDVIPLDATLIKDRTEALTHLPLFILVVTSQELPEGIASNDCMM